MHPTAPTVIFDLDGTLTATNAVDEECFVRALQEAWGLRNVDRDWSRYPHCTDRGIASHLFRRTFGRRVGAEEMSAFAGRFLALLDEARAVGSHGFRAIPGAAPALAALRRDGCCMGIATGCFRRSARVKLEAAGLDVRGIPLVAAEDALSRESIVRRAVRRARAAHGGARSADLVMVGDGSWDVAAARRLGARFLGIGSGRAAELLHAAGAARVLESLEPLAAGARGLGMALLTCPAVESRNQSTS